MRERETLLGVEFGHKPAFEVVSATGAISVALHRGPNSDRSQTVGIVSKWPRGLDTESATYDMAMGFDFMSAARELVLTAGPDASVMDFKKATIYAPLLTDIGYAVERKRVIGNGEKAEQVIIVTSPTVSYANQFAESVFGEDRVVLESFPGRYTALEFLTAFADPERGRVLVAEATEGEDAVWQLHDDNALQRLVWLGVDRELREDLRTTIRRYLDMYESGLASSANSGALVDTSLQILKFIMDRIHDFGDTLSDEIILSGSSQTGTYSAISVLTDPPDPDKHPGVPRDFELLTTPDREVAYSAGIQARYERALAFAAGK